MKSFLRLLEPRRFELKEKRSLFIAQVAPVQREEEAASFWAKVKEEHRNATHNCPAWRLLSGEFCSDDGEPGGTAGRPMLGVMLRRDLYCLAAVVTRYFGGIKLGPRGLIEAYSGALEGALEGAAVGKATIAQSLTLTTDYDRAKSLSHFFGALPLAGAVQTQWLEQVTLCAPVALEDKEAVAQALVTHQYAQLLLDEPIWGPQEVVALREEE